MANYRTASKRNTVVVRVQAEINKVKSDANHNQTSTHFNILTGCGIDNKGFFLRFLDTGTKHWTKATDPSLKFSYNYKDGLFAEWDKNYRVSHIRKTNKL